MDVTTLVEAPVAAGVAGRAQSLASPGVGPA
jgi:hypothetical protein